MAPLTWREVSAPSFSGVSESQRLSGQLLSTGFDSAIKTLDGLGESQKATANGELLSRIASFGKPEDLRTALADGTIFSGLDRSQITPETFDRANAQSRALLGDTQAGVQTDGMRLNNQNQSMVNDQLGWTNNKTKEFEAGRPAAVDLVNQIRTASALGTPEGRAQAAQLMSSGSAVFSAAGWTPEMINSQINGNMATTEIGVGTNTTLRDQGDTVKAHALNTEAKQLYDTIMPAYGNDTVAAQRAVRENADLNPQVAQQLLAMLGSEEAKSLQGPDSNAASYLLQSQVDAQQGGGAAPLVSLIDSKEGGGRYDTLFGHSQKAGGAFDGVDVTKMTLGQMDSFDKEYGGWVKDEIGRVTTPAGRFQIVGTTRRQVAQEMGLSADTVFSPQVQDAMFYHLVDKRISGPKSMEGKIQGLRQEWEGFKSVPDAKLEAAITAYQSGDKSALAGITSSQGTQEAPAQSQMPAQDLFQSTLDARSRLTTVQNEALFQGTSDLTNQAASVMDAMTVDGMFGSSAMAQSLLDPALTRESQVDSINRVKSSLGEGIDIKEDELAANINEVMKRYNMTSGQAATVLQNAITQNIWGVNGIFGNADVDYSKFDKLVGSVYNKDGKTKGEKFKPAMELLETARSKQNAAGKLSEIQAQVGTAQQRYVNLLERNRTNSTPALQKELQRAQLEYQALVGQMKKTVTQVGGDPRIGFKAE